MEALRRAGVITGEVVEWLMAPVLKTGDPQGSVGSNPTLSVLSALPTMSADQRDSKPRVRRMSLSSSSRCKGSVGERSNSGIRCS